MLYFVYGIQEYDNSVRAPVNRQYVLGKSPEEVQHTYLIRNRYYRLLNHHIVDLFKAAKQYAEDLFGHELPTRGHVSWAESPTIDIWNVEQLHQDAYQYEYTPNFIWSNTVQQASVACYDYFKVV